MKTKYMKRIITVCLALALCIGLVIPVHADALTEGVIAGIRSTQYCVVKYTSYNGSWKFFVEHELYVEDASTAPYRFAVLNLGGNPSLVSLSWYKLANRSRDSFKFTGVEQDESAILNKKDYDFYVRNYDISYGVSNGYAEMFGFTSGEFFVYEFTSEADLISYLSACVSSDFELANQIAYEKSSNYSKVQQKMLDYNTSYSSSIASPSKFYFSLVSENQATVVWEYDDNNYQGIQYDLKIDYYYCSKSVVYNVLSRYGSGHKVVDGVMDLGIHGFSYDSMNRIICNSTVEDYMNNTNGNLAECLLVSEEHGTYQGSMQSMNYLSFTPPSYDEKFQTVIPGLLYSDKKPVLVGVQASLVPYVVDGGVKKYGNTLVCRRFINDTLNSVLGSTFTEISKDENGNEFVSGNHTQDSSGNVVQGSSLPTTNAYINDLLSGDGLRGYLDIMQKILNGVPPQIWALISLALVVGILLLVFRYI